jgi:RNA polymerase sigma factor (sigma-70 family)
MNAQQYTKIVNEYSDRLYRYITKQGVPREDANDIMQNCYEALWKSSMTTETECGKYIFGVAHNQCADYYRKEKKIVYKELVPETSAMPKNDTTVMQQYVHKILLGLSPEQRSLVLLKDYEGYSYDEIANITGYNLSQVKVYLHRARILIQEKIGNLKNVI